MSFVSEWSKTLNRFYNDVCLATFNVPREIGSLLRQLHTAELRKESTILTPRYHLDFEQHLSETALHLLQTY